MLKDDIFNITSQAQFESTALQVYEFQYTNNVVYKRFCDLLNRKPNLVKTIKDIPFLPIQFFKSETILSSAEDIDITFKFQHDATIALQQSHRGRQATL